MKTHYEILGLRADATTEDVRKAWLAIARECHPDTHPGNKAAAERYRLSNDAQQVLSDPDKRYAYDLSLAAPFEEMQPGANGNGVGLADILGFVADRAAAKAASSSPFVGMMYKQFRAQIHGEISEVCNGLVQRVQMNRERARQGRRA